MKEIVFDALNDLIGRISQEEKISNWDLQCSLDQLKPLMKQLQEI